MFDDTVSDGAVRLFSLHIKTIIGGVKKWYVLISRKSFIAQRFTVSAREWQPATDARFSLHAALRAETGLLTKSQYVGAEGF